MENQVSPVALGPIPCVLQTAALTRTTLALYCGASGDHHPLHVDIDWVRENTDLQDVIGHGMLTMAYFGRLLTDWAGPGGVRSLNTRFLAPLYVHDILTCTGSCTQVRRQQDLWLVDVSLEACCEQRSVVIARGEATVCIRDGGDQAG